jgi:hypothetical protein
MQLDPFNVHIETKLHPGGDWWGLVWLFYGNPEEPPIFSGPWADEAQARQKAEALADGITRARTEGNDGN